MAFMPKNRSDVLIAGGGLAGLTLALQLKQARPDLDVTVLEQRRHPVPVAAHKVGESTVEVGAHYFANRLNLKDHMESQQLKKFGLRFFFGGPRPGSDMAAYDELGVSDFLPVTSYQIDRGIFENYLLRTARAAGVTVHDGTSVKSIAIDGGASGHSATVRLNGEERALGARWLVDSTGRQARLKNHLGLRQPVGHANAAVWLRTATPLNIDDYGTGVSWNERCSSNSRRLSTNHVMGTGYWFWLIPLGSGATSIGLVFDPIVHPVRDVNTFDRLLQWLDKREPLMAEILRDDRDNVLDFLVLRDYAHSSRQVFSSDRWALSGEAGVFSDPFYSPGSDFIAISNSIITELIARKSRSGKTDHRAQIFQQLYFSIFDSNLTLYESQYPGFGDRDLMLLKTTWDYSFYWAVLAYIFFSGKLTDVGFLAATQRDTDMARALNRDMQDAFRNVAVRRRCFAADGRFSDHAAVSILPDLKHQLIDGDGDTQHELRLSGNVRLLEELATVVRALLGSSVDGRDLGPLGEIRELQTLACRGEPSQASA